MSRTQAKTEARILRPAKSAMQSGRQRTRAWVLEFEPEAAKAADPLMGWAGSTDTQSQVRLQFPSRDAAVAFAEKNGLSYTVQDPRKRRVRPKSYAKNFIPETAGPKRRDDRGGRP